MAGEGGTGRGDVLRRGPAGRRAREAVVPWVVGVSFLVVASCNHMTELPPGVKQPAPGAPEAAADPSVTGRAADAARGAVRGLADVVTEVRATLAPPDLTRPRP